MAKIYIKNIEKTQKHGYKVHDDVDATYTTFSPQGKRYFQFDTCMDQKQEKIKVRLANLFKLISILRKN